MILPQTTPILPPSPLFSSLSLSLPYLSHDEPLLKVSVDLSSSLGRLCSFLQNGSTNTGSTSPPPPPPSSSLPSLHTHTQHTLNFSPSGPHHFFTPSPMHPSLGTRSLKNPNGGSGKLAGVEVYTTPGMQVHFQLAFD